MTNQNELATKPHYPILDGLRGVAALLVVAFHIFETHSNGDHTKQIINHGYLAVDFFFLLSGYVIGYAYDDRWTRLSTGGFFKRRLIRLQPMVVMGMLTGAICFYFSASPAFPGIADVPVWKLLCMMLIGFTLLPVPLSWDIRGWQEMHPLDGPGWSLFFEYIVNILYAAGIRKFSKTALSILVALAGIALLHYTITSPNGDVIGGWSLNAAQLRIGFTRVMFPFFAGLLLSRAARPTSIKNAFGWSSLLLAIVLCTPRIGTQAHPWQNGLYDSLNIILLFPLIVYIGAGGTLHSPRESKICKFLGDISYPIYITHYPLIYIYTGWVSKHPDITLAAALPWALLTFAGAITIGYATLKLYDEPVRAWLNRKWK